ncbi:MAG: OsmC family protein [Thermodesulfovibrionales bacterium]
MVQAKVKWVDGLRFVGEATSGHAIVLDADREVGGTNTGVRPTELLLIGLGGCSGMDVASVLQKKKQKISGVEMNVQGQKAQDYPQKFTEIDIEFVVTGKDLSEEAVRKAVELSMTKYCSVKATLEGTAKISYRYRIVQE